MKSVRAGILAATLAAGALSFLAPMASAQVFRPDTALTNNERLCRDLHRIHSEAVAEGDTATATASAKDIKKYCH